MKAFFDRPFTQLTLTSLLVSLGLLTALPSHAEGSRSLVNTSAATEYRPFLEDFNGTTAGITRRNQIKVFVNNGETLYLGSSAQGLEPSGVSTTVSGQRIRYTPPGGNTSLCPATEGRILNRTQELAGPFDSTNAGTNANGYTPCKVTVNQTGIWTIEFLSPNPNGNDPAGNGLNTQVGDDWQIGGPNDIQKPNDGATGLNTYNNRGIAAWDVTVYAGTTERIGRAYANYLPLNTGANSRGIGANFYVLTDDGYQYTLDLNRLDPFGFILFANNKGFKSSTTGNSLYRSIALSGGNLPTETSVHSPTAADTATDITHKVFFNPPDPTMPSTASVAGGTTWLYNPPSAPPAITGFAFQGVEANTSGKAGTFPLGGNFLFNANVKGIYNIILDLNQDGVFGNGNDRILVGNAVQGNNTVLWDGKDDNDVTVNPSNVAYNASITLNVGEVHFPILDPENNPQGIIVTRTNGGSSPNSTVYYNDTGLSGGTAPNPINALGGVNSTGGAHGFNNNFGNEKGINTWANLPSAPATFNNIQIQAADLKITKTDNLTIVAPGSAVSYIIDVTNFNNPPTSVSNVQGIKVTDTFPSQITNVTLGSCQIISGTGTCGSSNITGNTLNATLDLNSGATARLIVNGTVAPNLANGTVITNTAKVERQPDVTDPVNDDNDSNGDNNLSETAIDTTTVVTVPPPLLNKSVRFPTNGDLNGNGVLEIGEIVEYTIIIRNSSSTQPIPGLVIADAIPNQLEVQGGTVAINNSNNSLQPAQLATSLPAGNFDGTGNPITLTQPGTLAAGGSFRITYRAKIKPGSANPIANQARANYTGDGGTPVVSDASGSTNPTQPGKGNNPGFPNQTGEEKGEIDQVSGGPNDPTQLYFTPPVTPAGSKSVRLATDVDNSGSVTQGDVLEYTVIYFNGNNFAVTDFLATDTINATQLEFIPGSYSFIASQGTTVTANPNYNGTTDQNLTNSVTKGSLAANGGRVTIKFRARIVASAGVNISNQAVATSTGGLSTSVTDAVAGPGDIPQILNDGVNTANLEDSGDDEPTLLTVVAAGNARLRLVKRITNVFRNGSPLSGVSLNSFVDDPGDANDTAAGWPSNFLQGVFQLGPTVSLTGGDEVEYTVYYLSDGPVSVKNVRICDPIPATTSYLSDTFGAGQGISLNRAGQITSLTNIANDDAGAFLGKLAPLPNGHSCPDPSNPNGSVLVNLGDIPNISGQNYGFVRFRVRVD